MLTHSSSACLVVKSWLIAQTEPVCRATLRAHGKRDTEESLVDDECK